ncbi:helix-turn-helix transcriptional regulator [Alkaliphilus peptidifermentans]|uniref:Predicted DNA-binding transcriptional regulator YafY, contains an HTH and WYL domains n=1 Tax=Alkaliphilus peptidifermentans DSM 18978 TaxID=1120976 RepID=A0A1G5KUT2_9FIRM|nr:YafY family protein [Alkaliphilus peptidifermentans]SCZ03888.1 Predicted DNA-binding transcriptional regulator YafY, contains an HTH and WYL domains [Alkaliphilus peptidifermentans DSM 18978]
MKIDRLLGILMMIINNEKITARELSEYFQVSVRTIQRDIDTLSMAGIPVYSEVGKKGGYQLLSEYKLDKNFLKTDEAKVLNNLLESLQKAVPYTEIKSVYNKFSMLLPSDSEDHKIVFKLSPLIKNKRYKENLDIITKARDGYHKIYIQYIDANFQESDRIICPYTMVMMGSTWYIYGYCELREDFRMFKLSRMISCKLLECEFEIKETSKPLPWENNLESGRPTTKIKLEIDKSLQAKLPDYIDYENCRIEGDKIIVHLNFTVDEWLYSFLLGLVPYVKIIEPSWLREEFISRLNLSIEKNKL